jgi:hypothetical protein
MKDIEIDFYSGFDDDNEIVFFIETDKYKKKLRIWQGYFDEIMKKIELEDHDWTGIAYYYNLLLGWNVEENWQIPNIEKVLLQFKNIELTPDCQVGQIYYNAECEILKEIIKILSEAIDKNLSVYIRKIE